MTSRHRRDSTRFGFWMPRMLCSAAFALLSLGTAASQVVAPDPAASDPTGGYADAFLKLRGTFAAPTAKEISRRQVAALSELSELVKTGQYPRENLDVSSLREELALGSKASVKRLTDFEKKLYLDVPGNELSEAVRTREALGQFRDAVAMATQPDAALVFDRTLGEAAHWLTKHAAGPTAATSYELGRRLGWLEKSCQPLPLVAVIQNRYSQPNFRLRVSKLYFEDYFRKDINETSPVAQVIRAAEVTGMATTRGTTHLELVPSEDSALFRVVMTGTMTSRVVAAKTVPGLLGKPIHVRVPSTGHSTLRVEKMFRLTDAGLTPLPAVAHCQTSTTFLDVLSSAKMDLVRNKVVERAYLDKPAGEAEAASKAEVELRRKADKVTSPGIVKEVLDGYKLYYLNPQIRVGSAPLRTAWKSTEDHVQYSLVRRTSHTLAAAAPPPEMKGDHHLEVALHQSEVNNELGPLLGGIWMTDEHLCDIYKIIFGYTPRSLRLGSHMPRWSMRLDPIRPFQLEFGGDRVAMTFYGTDLRVGDKTSSGSFSVGATYSFKLGEDGIEFIREGSVRVVTSSSLDTTVRTFLHEKFTDVFAGTLAPDGLVPPDGGLFDPLRAISIQEARTQDGWALIGMRDIKKKLVKKTQ